MTTTKAKTITSDGDNDNDTAVEVLTVDPELTQEEFEQDLSENAKTSAPVNREKLEFVKRESDKISRQVVTAQADFKQQEQKLSYLGIEKVSHPKTEHEMPSRIIFAGKKLKLSRSRLWYVQCFGSFTRTELEHFVKAYSKDLTIDETEVIDLYLRSMAGEKEAKNMLWDLHREIFRVLKSVYVEELKQQRMEQETGVTNKLSAQLAEIGKAIMASEAEKVNDGDSQKSSK